MATDFKYATIADLNKYFNRVNDFDSKVQIFPTLTSGNLHLFRDSGYVSQLFVNGEELAAAQSSSGAVDSNGEWYYESGTNQVEYYNSNYSSTTIIYFSTSIPKDNSISSNFSINSDNDFLPKFGVLNISDSDFSIRSPI